MLPDDLPVLPFRSQAEWESWLEQNHADAAGLWLKIAKKASGIETITHAEALDVALCFGWIDGQRGRLDDEWFLQRFTPRRVRSRWSQINRDKVEFATLSGSNRYAVLYRIHDAKRAETRTRRIEKFVAMLARGETIH
jgi:uncharacterized protein YdeI (YjbR/CyaY-like superfamily)